MGFLYTLLDEFADIPRFIRGNPNYPPEEPDFSNSAEYLPGWQTAEHDRVTGARMPKSDDELEKIAEPTSSGAPYSLDTTVISGWRLLQIAGAIFIIYLIFHFLEKHW